MLIMHANYGFINRFFLLITFKQDFVILYWLLLDNDTTTKKYKFLDDGDEIFR